MKRINNKILIAVLGGLLVIFAAVRYFRTPKLQSSLPSSLIEFDSAATTGIIVTPGRDRTQEIRLTRTSGKWELKLGDRIAKPDQGTGATSIRMLMALKPQRLVSRNPSNWSEYNLSDSAATSVKLMDGDRVQAEIRIGKTGITPGPNGQFGGGYTFVRLADEDDVYAVEGFLEGQFNKTFDDWRDKSFTRITRDSVIKVSFSYPADSSFVLEKRDSLWYVGGQAADEAKVIGFLGQLEYKNVGRFADDNMVTGQPLITIDFHGRRGVIVTIEAWKPLLRESSRLRQDSDGQAGGQAGDTWIFRSSHQRDVFFSGAGTGVDRDILLGKKHFLL